MSPLSPETDQLDSPVLSLPDERRKNLRFGLHFSGAIWTPTLGKNWLPCKTLSVGIRGSSLETSVALPVESRIDYIVTFPSELTHAMDPLRVRFCGQVLRVDAIGENQEGYRVAVSNLNYKFLRDLTGELPSIEQSASEEGRSADPPSQPFL